MRTPMAREPLVSGGNRELPVDAPRPKTYGDGGDDHHTEEQYEQQSGIHNHQPVERLTFAMTRTSKRAEPRLRSGIFPRFC